MHLDIKTAVFLTSLSALVMSISLFVTARFYPGQSKGMKLWAGACGGLAVAWMLIGLRGQISDFLSIVVANTLIVSSAAIYYRAIKDFKEEAFRPLVPYLMVGATMVSLIFFRYVTDNLAIRAAIISGLGGIITLMSATSILKGGEKQKPFSYWVTGVGFLICTFVSEFRVVYIAFVNPKLSIVFTPGAMQDALYICLYASVVVLTFGFVMMLNDKANADLVRALAEVKTLSGLLPICAYCKNIRDDRNYWQKIESYISDRTDTLFSHSICPDCYAREVVPKFEAFRNSASGNS